MHNTDRESREMRCVVCILWCGVWRVLWCGVCGVYYGVVCGVYTVV